MNILEKFDSSYIISKDGSITSLKKMHFGKPMKFRKDKDGYQLVNLCVDGKKTTEKVHRLIAQKYIPNPNNLPQINHIDGKKENNNVSNLEWCTNKMNIEHSNRLELRPGCIRVAQIDKDGKLMNTYKSLSDAGRKTKTRVPLLSVALRSGFPDAMVNGYRWKRIIQ